MIWLIGIAGAFASVSVAACFYATSKGIQRLMEQYRIHVMLSFVAGLITFIAVAITSVNDVALGEAGLRYGIFITVLLPLVVIGVTLVLNDLLTIILLCMVTWLRNVPSTRLTSHADRKSYNRLLSRWKWLVMLLLLFNEDRWVLLKDASL